MRRQELPLALLSYRQESELVNIILDQRGQNLSQSEFSETLYQLMEDLSGFENAKPDTLKSLSGRLWKKYDEIGGELNGSEIG